MKRGAVLGAASGASLGLALVLRASVRVPLFEEAASRAEPWLLSSMPRLGALVAAGSAGALLGGLLGRRGHSRLLTPFLAAGLAVAVFLPGVFSWAPFLAAFSGRFLDSVLLAALLLSLGRLSRDFRLPARIALSPSIVAGIAFVLYLGVGFETGRSVGLSGDEPHYLLVTYSLLHDFDLRVENNYANEDYRHFYQGKIGPHLAAGTPYSVHGVGLPLLLLPGFALAGLAGVLVTEALLAALLVRGVYKTAWDLTASSEASLFAASGFALTAPALFLSVSAYPELPAALVVVTVAGRLLGRSPPGRTESLLLTLSAGALPFLHIKFIPLALVLLGALAYRFGRSRAALSGLAAGAVVSGAATLLFFFWTTGSVDPRASYGHQRIFIDRIPIGVAGLLFDQEAGLLASAPVYLLGFTGLVSLFRRDSLFGAVALLALSSVFIPGAAHPLWSGGTSPPARFLFPALPLLAVAGSCLVAREPDCGVAPWRGALLSLSLTIGAAMLLLPGQPLFLNTRSGRGRVWEALSSSWDVSAYLPSIERGDARSLAAAFILAALLLLAVLAQTPRRRLPLPPLASLLLAGAWMQDLTSVSRGRELESRWVLEAMSGLGEQRGAKFLLLPSFEVLDVPRASRLVSLPLDRDAVEGDPRYWWSRSYPIPAGSFRVSGVSAEGLLLCNGEGSFASGEEAFRSEVALKQFRIRARYFRDTPRLRLLEPGSSRADALRSVALGSGWRLHGLDDEAFLDPAGFWIRKGSRAAFAVERVDDSLREARLRIANGGVENRISLSAAGSGSTLKLGAWEERDISIATDERVTVVSIESEGGFRPREHDPRSKDERELGVLVRASPAFD